MVIVDANVLLSAGNQDMPQHARAKRWVEAALGGNEAIGFAWVVLLAFVRLSTLPALVPTPLAATTALELVDDWLSASAAVVVHPPSRHASVLRDLLAGTGTAGTLA